MSDKERKLCDAVINSPVMKAHIDKIVKAVSEKLVEAYKAGYANGYNDGVNKMKMKT